MVRVYFVFAFLFLALLANAQREHHFTKGLILSDSHRYGREALVVDHVSYLLNAGKFQTPVEQGTIQTEGDGATLVWKFIEADSANKFRGDLLQNAYIYLTYNSDKAGNALLNVSGNSMVYFNNEPRTGDIYSDGWMNLPVTLVQGKNEILIRCGGFARWQGVSAKLILDDKAIQLHTTDITLPHVVIGQDENQLTGAVVVINNTNSTLTDLTITASCNGQATVTKAPWITKQTVRKVPFNFATQSINAKGDYAYTLTLKQGNKVLDEKQISISAVNSNEHHSQTFISEIDGSLQYYGVAPSTKSMTNPALFLSVHGAGVEAIGQARAYEPKDWGVVVTPTNRRPRGFNWEDWGRMDALEVLEIAKKKFTPDPARIYLTGHSMGGHGTWYLGATYPSKWAAIAPCAGYPTLKEYGSADGKLPAKPDHKVEALLFRSSNGSNVIGLSQNYKGLGVYIHHGDDDRVVSVDYARQMRALLGNFHNDFSYYEYPGGSHWFGNESVDWKPIFDFFKWHTIKADTASDQIDFITANSGVSSEHRWASVIQQEVSLDFSELHLIRDKKARTIKGTTSNVEMLKLNVDFASPGVSITLTLDSVTLKTTVNAEKEVWLRRTGSSWAFTSKVSPKHKNPTRNGLFKEAFNHRMVFVYGTRGTVEENRWAYNKARYDAEVWYYRGNGAIDIIADKDFTPEKYKDRGVVIFGNSKTNSAWSKLLKTCPINVTSDKITLDKHVFIGKNLATYFTWPRPDSDIAMVAVVSGTGLEGMKATDPNQYFAAASGFPDFLVFTSKMLSSGAAGLKAAGFFDNEWKVKEVEVSTN